MTFLEQLLNANFNFKNVNSFLSMLAAIVALVFAIFKLLAYIRDSKIKSKMLEIELEEKKNHCFFEKWNRDFDLKHLKEDYENNSDRNRPNKTL